MNEYLNPKKYFNFINKKIYPLFKYKEIKYLIDKARSWSNRKNFIQCVAFPRNGYHLLVNLLLKYFSGNTHYQDADLSNT